MISMEINRSNETPSSNLRKAYLINLQLAQELYVERLISESECFEILVDAKVAGYALIREATLLEYFLHDDHRQYAGCVLSKIVEVANVQSVICQSFDTFLMEACSNLEWNVVPIAFLFRGLVDSTSSLPELSPREATDADLDAILSIHDGFFDDEQEIKSYLEADAKLFIYKSCEDLIGCGIVKKIVPWRCDYDVGMVVAPSHRNKGYATCIVSHLKDFCLTAGWNPVAGCSIDNLASFRALSKAGFTSEHRLLAFSVSSATRK